jgi:hypothetical protein
VTGIVADDGVVFMASEDEVSKNVNIKKDITTLSFYVNKYFCL